MGDFVESTKEASRGGFQGIKKIRGLLVSLRKVSPPDGWETTKEQIEAKLEDASILEMSPGEEEFELRNGEYTFLISYAEPGKVPHASSAYMKCWIASAEKLGKKPSDFIGSYVTLSKIPTVLFKQPKLGEDKKPIKGEDGKKIYEDVLALNTFSFVPDEETDSSSVREYVRSLVVGLNPKAALRKLILDTRAKQYPEYKEALGNGTLAELLELTVVDGKFQEPTDGTSNS